MKAGALREQFSLPESNIAQELTEVSSIFNFSSKFRSVNGSPRAGWAAAEGTAFALTFTRVSQPADFIKSIKFQTSWVAGMAPYPEAYVELMIVQMSAVVILKLLTGCMI